MYCYCSLSVHKDTNALFIYLTGDSYDTPGSDGSDKKIPMVIIFNL
jgi:hypothetical protein